MAHKGKLLPLKVREQIWFHAEYRMPKAMIARVVGVSRRTVQKYLKNFAHRVSRAG